MPSAAISPRQHVLASPHACGHTSPVQRLRLPNATSAHKLGALTTTWCAQATYWNTFYTANNTLVRGALDPALVAVLVQQIAVAPPGGSFSIDPSPSLPAPAQPLSAWSFYGAFQVFAGARPGHWSE